MKKITFLLFAIFLFGCGEKKIDASTEQNLFQSINTIKLSLTKESDVKDIDAFLEILVERNDPLFLNYHPEIKLADLHGMNADQLLVYYHRYLIAMAKKREEVADRAEKDVEAQEKKELLQLLAEHEEVMLNSSKVSIKFVGLESSSYSSYVYVDVLNESDVAIESLSFVYRFKTASRSMPWFAGVAYIAFRDGGLEPNETRRDRFYVSDKNVIKIRNDHPEAKFEFFLRDFYTFDGVNVSAEMSDNKLNRLKLLIDKYGVGNL